MSIETGVRSVVRSAISNALREAADEREQAIRTFLDPNEQLIGYETATTRMPFLLRIMPFVPDVMTRPKVSAIAVTDRRLLIVKLGRSLTNAIRASLVEALPRRAIRSLTTAGGKLTVELQDGSTLDVKGAGPQAVKQLRHLLANS